MANEFKAKNGVITPVLTSTVAIGTAPLVVTSTTRVNNLNVATAGTADTLTTGRTINGTTFNGSANITTTSWGTSRTITIGSTGKAVDGSGNVSWTTAEIGATTVGGNFFALANPSAITFPRINADNTVTALSAASMRTALGSTTLGDSLFTLTNPSAITFLRVNANNTVTAQTAASFRTDLGSTTVGDSFFTLTNPSTITFPKINANNTVTAESAATHRTSIGATTVGGNLFTLTNPSAITFIRLNADNTVSALDAASFRTAIGASGLPTDSNGTPGFADVILLNDGTTAAWGRSETIARTMNSLSEYSGNVTHASGSGVSVQRDFGVDGPGWGIKVTAVSDRASYKSAGYDDATGTRCKTLSAKSVLEGVLRVPTVPSGTEDFTIRFGYTDEWAYGDEGANSIVFLLDRTAYSGSNPGNLRAITRASSTNTATDTTITLANDTAYVLKIVIVSASSVKFYINGVLRATHTTNIPALTTTNIKPSFVLKKTVGSTARDAFLSGMMWWKEI